MIKKKNSSRCSMKYISNIFRNKSFSSRGGYAAAGVFEPKG